MATPKTYLDEVIVMLSANRSLPKDLRDDAVSKLMKLRERELERLRPPKKKLGPGPFTHGGYRHGKRKQDSQ